MGRSRVVPAVAALVALAGVIRFLHLGTWSFWADEVATLRDMGQLREVIGYPVGYALIGLTVRLSGAGPTEFAARFLPAGAGVLTVPLIYLMGRRLFGERAGVLAGVFLALSCYHLFFSQFARYYTLVMLFGLAGMWAAYRGIEENRRRWLAAAVALLGLAFWTHWAAGLLVPALGAYVLWLAAGKDRPKGLTVSNVAILFGPFLLGGLVMLPRLLGFFSLWRGDGGFSLWRVVLVGVKLGYRLEAGLLICAAAGAWLLLRAGDPRAKWLVTYLAVPVVLLLCVVAFSQGGSRFGIVVLPPVVLLGGATVDALLRSVPKSRRGVVWALVVLVVASMLVKDFRYFVVERGQRPRWGEAVGYVSALTRGEVGETVVVSTSPEIVEHYWRGGHVRALREMAAEELEGRLNESGPGRVYVLVEHVANVAPSPEQQDVLRRHASSVKQWPLHVGPMDYSITLYSN